MPGGSSTEARTWVANERRTEQREATREEPIEQQDRKAAGSSRLGKEAKIGVTVILAVAGRLRRRGGRAADAIECRRTDAGVGCPATLPNATGPAARPPNEALFKGFRSKQLAGPQRADGRVGQGGARLCRRRPSTAISTSGRRPRTGRSDRPATCRTGRASTSRPRRAAAHPVRSAQDHARQPIRAACLRSAVGPGAWPIEPRRRPPADVRLAPPAEEKRPRPGHDGTGGLASKRAAAEGADSLPPLPPHRAREKSRASVPWRSPPSLPPDTSYAEASDPPAPVTPVSRYGEGGRGHRDDEYRRGDNDYRDSCGRLGI